jgi:hypothetical protein
MKLTESKQRRHRKRQRVISLVEIFDFVNPLNTEPLNFLLKHQATTNRKENFAEYRKKSRKKQLRTRRPRLATKKIGGF